MTTTLTGHLLGEKTLTMKMLPEENGVMRVKAGDTKETEAGMTMIRTRMKVRTSGGRED